ncbi:hypothetical protein [Coprobacter sp.]
MLIYVCSGEMILQAGQTKIKIRTGECAFKRKDNQVSIVKQPKAKGQFIRISLVLSKTFLRFFYQTIDKKICLYKCESKVRVL